MATFTEPLMVGNIKIEFDVGKLKHSIKPRLKNFFGTYGLNADQGQFDSYEVPTGTIESVALREGLTGLRVRGHKIELTSKNPVDDFPEELMDLEEKHEIDVYEEALKALVKHNIWLGKKAPYAMVFAGYLPEEEKKELAAELDLTEDGAPADPPPSADPTPSPPVTFGERLMSGSGTGSADAS